MEFPKCAKEFQIIRHDIVTARDECASQQEQTKTLSQGLSNQSAQISWIPSC